MIVYTALFGGYDQVRPPPAKPAVLFTDRAVNTSLGWDTRVVLPPDPKNLARSNRHFKLQPHKYLPWESRVLYIDARVKLNHSPDTTLKMLQDLAGADYDVFTLAHSLGHDWRREIEWVRKSRITHSSVLDVQLARYEAAGLPNAPVPQAAIIVAKLPESEALFDAWWAEVRDYSHRDQVSFAYAQWKTNADVFFTTFKWAREHLFSLRPHAKRQLRDAT